MLPRLPSKWQPFLLRAMREWQTVVPRQWAEQVRGHISVELPLGCIRRSVMTSLFLLGATQIFKCRTPNRQTRPMPLSSIPPCPIHLLLVPALPLPSTGSGTKVSSPASPTSWQNGTRRCHLLSPAFRPQITIPTLPSSK